MDWRVLFDAGATYLVPTAIAAWVVVTFFALWRVGKITDRAKSLEDMTGFFEAMIRSDQRYPIWLWRGGEIQASKSVRSLLKLEDRLETLSDLIATGDEEGGLSRDVVEEIEAQLRREKPVSGPMVAMIHGSADKVMIDHQPLIPLADQWPVSVLWLEDSYGLGALDVAPESRKASFKSIDHSLKELTAAIDGLPNPVWIRDNRLQLSNINQAYMSAVDGRSRDEVIGGQKELFEQQPLRAARQAAETGDAVRERQYAVVSGQRRAFNVVTRPIGSEGHILAVAVDVTGEEEALSELSRVLDSQSETLNRLRSPVAIFGPGKILKFYNSAFSRLSHLPEEVLSDEITHSELLDLMRENRRLPEQVDFKIWKEGILRQYTELLESYEEMWHLPDGTTHRVVTQPHPLGGLLILFEDVTDRLALERSYNTLIEVQKETLDNMREGIAVFGTDSRLKLSNPAFLDIWLLDAEAVADEPHLDDLLELVRLEKSSQEVFDLKSVLPTWVAERSVRSGRWIRDDNRVMDFSLVPLPDGGIMLTQNDVTERYQVEQALRERSSALEAADRLKSEFIKNMSYELRTPLNSILGFGELLDQKLFGDLTEAQAGHVKSILRAAGDLRDMITDVLDLAVIEAGEMDIDRDPLDMPTILQDTLVLTTDKALKRNIEITQDLAPQTLSLVGDANRLKQVFYNMVSMMTGFAATGSKLMILYRETEDGGAISVEAVNVGLNHLDRDRVIADIEAGSGPRSRKSTGLDLALVRSIVELHGGSIEISKIAEQGIALACYLPAGPGLIREIHDKY